MTTDVRRQPGDRRDDEALRWLKRRLEWEHILHALRDAAGTDPGQAAACEQKPAAA